MIKPYLLLDIDGVVLDWVGAFRSWLKSKGINTLSQDPETWELDNYVPGYDISELIKAFNSTMHFSNIPGFSDARLYLHKLSKLYKIIGITAGGNTTFHKFYRKLNLLEEFSDAFDDKHNLICLELNESKKDILESFPKGSIWVEDRPKNAELGVEAGHTSILIERSYNKDYHNPDVIKLSSWHEIYDFLS